LENRESVVRAGAAKALGWIGPKASETIPRLIQHLSDTNSDVRQQSAEALGEIGEDAKPKLIEALAAAEAPSRSSAAFALGWIGVKAKDAAPNLAQLVEKESDPDARASAMNALSKVGFEPDKMARLFLNAINHEHEKVRLSAVNGLLTVDAQITVPLLIERLQTGPLDRQERAAHILGRIGPKASVAVPHLINTLRTVGEEPPFFPFSDAIVQIGTRAVPALIHELETKEEDWPIRCLRAIGQPALPGLIEVLGGNRKRLRIAAVQVLSGLGPDAKGAEAALVRLLEDSDAKLRSEVLVSLHRVGAKPASYFSQLEKALKDSSPEVRKAAATAAYHIGAEAKQTLPLLVQACKDTDASVQAEAVRALGAMGADAANAVGTLVELLNGNGRAQLDIIRTLGKIGSASEPAVPRLIDLIEGSRKDIRAQVFVTLGQIGPSAKAAAPALTKSSKDPEREIRASAIAALGRIESDPKAIFSILLEALNDEASDVRKPAAVALGKLGSQAQEAVPALFSMLKVDDDRLVVLESLRQIKVKSVPLLIEALAHRDPAVRSFACESLARLGSEAKEAVPALQKSLNDDYDSVRRQARMALRRIEDG